MKTQHSHLKWDIAENLVKSKMCKLQKTPQNPNTIYLLNPLWWNHALLISQQKLLICEQWKWWNSVADQIHKVFVRVWLTDFGALPATFTNGHFSRAEAVWNLLSLLRGPHNTSIENSLPSYRKLIIVEIS